MTSWIERAIAERARSQLGLITRRQLHDAGISHQTVARRVAAGLLIPVGARTYRAAAVGATPEGTVLAACLDLGGVASHRTAAWLHGLLPRPGPITDITVPKGRSVGPRTNLPNLRVHTTTNLSSEDLTRVAMVPVTSVARSLLGLAALDVAEVSDELLTATVERAVRTRLASDRWLWWLLEQRRCRGRNGVSRFEEVLARRAQLGPTESWLEREVLRVLTSGGLPLPVIQRRIRRRGAFVARVDFVYESALVVLEALGHAWHSSREQLTIDAMRASELQLLGFAVHQFTYDQIVGAPASVLATVEAALRVGSRRLVS